METTEKRPEQADLTRQARSKDHSTRGPLGRLMLIAFIGYAFMYFVAFFYILLVGKVFIPPIVIEAALVLLATAVVATRWRWAPLLGALVALLTLLDPIFQPHNIYTYTHPGVTVIPQTTGANTSADGQPVVHMTASNFASNVVLVPKGSSLLIVNDSSVEHILQNGAWDASGIPHSGAEPGAPALHNMDITGGSQEIGPFATAGIYHIYCTLHPGMNLTIVVQ